jgi:gas vesicle protein
LDENAIVIEQDIKLDDLYNMKNSGKLFLENGQLNLQELNKKLNIVLTYKKEQSEKLNKELNENNSKINREVKRYIEENNSAINEAQDRIKENSSDSDNWFVKTLNSILEMLKY